MTRSEATESIELPVSLHPEGNSHAGPERSYLDVGLYSPVEAARLLGMPVATLRAWLNDGRSKPDSHPSLEPLIRRADPELVARGLLTFSELVSLRLIRQLRQEGLRLAAIRSLAQRAAARFATRHPFATRQFYTEGAPLLDRDGEAGRPTVVEASLPESEALLATLADSLDFSEDGTACRYWPLGRERRVVLDRARAFGQPSDPLSGVPTHVMAGMVAAGESVDAVAAWYRVDREAVIDAVEFEQSLPMTRLPRAA